VELEYAFAFPTLRRQYINYLLEAGHLSSFDGMVSTSNHLVPEEKEVKVSTSKPIWWTVELKKLSWD